MNPSLIKSSTNIPGISDHAILITDMETKHHYQKTTSRKRYIYSKANWNNRFIVDLCHTNVGCDVYYCFLYIYIMCFTFYVTIWPIDVGTVDIISVEKTEFITNCEIEWVSIKLKNNKDLLKFAFE
jgi:hypothetical protein